MKKIEKTPHSMDQGPPNLIFIPTTSEIYCNGAATATARLLCWDPLKKLELEFDLDRRGEDVGSPIWGSTKLV